MDDHSLNQNFVRDLSCFWELQGPPLSSAVSAGLQLGESGHSVQMLDSTESGCTGWQATSQDIPSFSRTPDGFSIFHIAPAESELVVVEPSKKDTQQQIQTETVRSKATESFGTAEPVTLALKKLQVSGIGNSSQAKYVAYNKRKARQARDTPHPIKPGRPKPDTRYPVKAERPEPDTPNSMKARQNVPNTTRPRRARRPEPDTWHLTKLSRAKS